MSRIKKCTADSSSILCFVFSTGMLLTEFDTLINHDSEDRRISNIKWQCTLIKVDCNDRVKLYLKYKVLVLPICSLLRPATLPGRTFLATRDPYDPATLPTLGWSNRPPQRNCLTEWNLPSLWGRVMSGEKISGSRGSRTQRSPPILLFFSLPLRLDGSRPILSPSSLSFMLLSPPTTSLILSF